LGIDCASCGAGFGWLLVTRRREGATSRGLQGACASARSADKTVVGRAQFIDRQVEFGAALFEVTKLRQHHLLVQGEILGRLCGVAVGVEQIRDFGQGEAEVLALQNELEPGLLPAIVKARGAAAERLDQAALLVKAQGAQRNPINPSDFADRQHVGERLSGLDGGLDALGGGFHALWS
jgi:hypothetical protein